MPFLILFVLSLVALSYGQIVIGGVLMLIAIAVSNPYKRNVY